MRSDPLVPPSGRPLTEPQAALIRLLAEITVTEFLAEPDTPPQEGDTSEERR